ncbi:MAG TPA: hypothetical protein VD931_11335 [Baekduia sp.]|nr:hypothetical protein [Baekduia sp.]
MHIRTTALATAGLAGLALPVTAPAATKDVTVGGVSKAAPKDASINGFFPRTITVHAGDSVRFTMRGFGIVHFPKKGAKAPTFIIADPSRPVSGVNDAAGAPFHFNGRPALAPNPVAVAATRSGAPYTGAAVVNSGVPEGDGPPKPFLVRFPKTGTYRYYDAVHPGVGGTVRVVAKGRPVPSARKDRSTAARQLATAVATAKSLTKRSAPASTVIAGPDKGAATLFRFTPAAMTAKVGQRLTLTMSKGTSENHTFTFSNDLATLEKVATDSFFGPVLNPLLAYPSDPGVLLADGSQHGDGFLNTGVLSGGQDALPVSSQVVFTKPGIYNYLCAIHPDMKGKVTVTP